MTVSVPTGFLPSAFSGPAWDQARQLVLCRPHEDERMQAISAELAVRNLLHRYVYALDCSDIEGVMASFTADCVMNSPTGTVSGTAAIRTHYEQVLADMPTRFHLLTNTAVRISADLRSAEVSSYFFAVRQKGGEPPHFLGGLFADQVVERDGEWKICTRSIAVDVGGGFAPAVGLL
ncbi:nuclear transport factor 2 family protein [Kribbella shirazensis]|uniref:Uncharacterized protein (TIGR02246 family) n=1 Tax=Kribbella shirazensis TaxID=1105143 RepID=A0A7X5VHS3_9ACTN|nr:nuclear transport factor 2 family protein [Kribbella shirazensis]NIK61450.1 uncharacterized protein (TIGR02246 family) [Kribbella shirazensis]